MNLFKKKKSVLRHIKLPKGCRLDDKDNYACIEQPGCSVLKHNYKNDSYEWALAGDQAKQSIVENILKQFIALKPEFEMPTMRREYTWQKFKFRSGL